MTNTEVRDAIGWQRAAWVETGTGELAILVRAGRLGDEVLVRYAASRGGYHWTAAAGLRRREDLDAGPEPVWLQQARVSPRPPAVLWDIVNLSALKQQAMADAAVVLNHTESDPEVRADTWNTCPSCDASWKDAVPTLGLIHRTRLCDACVRRDLPWLAKPEFETDADGRRVQ